MDHMAKWIREEQEKSDESDEELANITYGRQRSKWLPRSLDLLFVGYTEEARLMELLADEEADEESVPDDGKLEGSGNDFEG